MPVSGGPGTTVARRQLGRRLRTLREQRGRTHDDIAEAQIASRSKMWKIETGRTAVKQGDVLALARLFELDGAVTDELLRLAAGTRDTGFVESFGSTMPPWAGMYGDLEAAASELWIYASELVPGILQTPGYARAVAEVHPTFGPAEIDQRVEFRARRQAAFFERERPGRLDAVITAGALRLRVGSDAVMQEQLATLRAASDRNQVRIRILPSENGLHSAMRGPFTLLLYDDDADPDLAHVESVVGARYFEREEHVAEFKQAHEWMRARTVPVEEFRDE